MGYGALTTDTKGDRNVAIGNSALESQNFTTTTDSYNICSRVRGRAINIHRHI